MSGYVRLHRDLIGHAAFRNDAESMAFAWLILRASWRPTRVNYKGRSVDIDRGQVAVSVRDFAHAMDRDKGWIERLLRRLRSATMIETAGETGGLVITICNFDKYQLRPADDKTVGETPGETPARQTQDTEQGKEPFLLPNGNSAAPDSDKAFWDNAKAYLGSAKASMIGKWVKTHGKQETATAISAAQVQRAVDPVQFIQGHFRAKAKAPNAEPFQI